MLLEKTKKCALICTTPLFYVLATACFGSSLTSSRSVLDPSELLEIQIEWVVYLVVKILRFSFVGRPCLVLLVLAVQVHFRKTPIVIG
jgi:hypothetical protein